MTTAKLSKCGVCSTLVEPFRTRCAKHEGWKAWKFIFRHKGGKGGELKVTKYATDVQRARSKAEEEAQSILGRDFAPPVRTEELWGV